MLKEPLAQKSVATRPADGGVRRWFELGPFTIFDVETTGMSPARDRIVEIAAVRISQTGEQVRWQSLVNPERSIPPEVIRIHHITEAMVADAPDFASIGPALLAFAGGSTLVAHHGRFDLAFLQESLNRAGLPLWSGSECRTLDTIPIIKAAYPGLPSYSLQALRQQFGLGHDLDGPAHRAFADIEWTLEVFAMAMQRLLDRDGG